MGTSAHVLVAGGRSQELCETAVIRLVELESRWSRFRHTSELSQLNAARGGPMIVSGDTYRLVSTMVAAWHATGGRYDPGMLYEITRLGYDRTFAEIERPPALRRTDPSARRSAVGSILLDPVLRSVTLPEGLGLDPGGIGKGLAGDMLAEELLDAGADGAMINLGGDVRVAGSAPDGGEWPIGVTDPSDPRTELLRMDIPAGAVATSSAVKRKWSDSAGDIRHHLLEPSTGLPIDNGIASVTVVAGEGWWAEALTKAVFSAGPDMGLEELHNASAMIVRRDGTRICTPDMQEAMR